MTPKETLAEKKKRTLLRSRWQNMRNRCSNKNRPDYKHYGGRGIVVCERWLNFEGFFEDMSPTFAEGLSLDRIDGDGNYEKSNCRWVTMQVQNANRRNNVKFEYQGKSLTVPEWARLIGMNPLTLHTRLMKRKWSVEVALNTPIRVGNRYKSFKSSNTKTD